MAKDVYAEILRLREKGESAALATIVSVRGSSPAALGSKILMTRDKMVAGTVGGGCLEADVFAEAREVIRTERPKNLKVTLTEERSETGLTCGGTVEIFVEPLVHPIAFVFGGGHVGAKTAEVAAIAGFQAWVLDDREAFASSERHPSATTTRVIDFEKVAEAGLPVTENSYLVLVTRGHQFDQVLLDWAVRTPARYIGMIGSRRKILLTYQNLVEKGADPVVFERVRAPIGVDISAVTAAEIAVAIVAEMIEERRRDQPRRRNRRVSLADLDGTFAAEAAPEGAQGE